MLANDIPTLPKPFDSIDHRECLVIDLPKGATLFNQNDVSAGMFYLVTGAVVLRRFTDQGHTVVLHRARAGETFAEASLFSEAYHCTAVLTMDSQIIQCRQGALLELLNNEPGFAQAVAARFASQIQSCRRSMELLSIRSADERVMAALRDGMLLNDISEFADSIGLAPETVYRALSQLTSSGHLRKTGRGVYRLV